MSQRTQQIAIGTLVAFYLSELMTSVLYGVPPTDPLTFIVVTAILLAVAILACLLPARRATNIALAIALHAS